MQEERKTEIEIETETESEIVIGTEKESAPERERGSVITVLHQVFSTGLLSVQEFVHMCIIEFIFGNRMENLIQLGKDCLKSSYDSHFKSIRAIHGGSHCLKQQSSNLFVYFSLKVCLS